MDISQLIVFYKKTGETPLQALNRLRLERPELAQTTLSYAGRLDPLAEGEMLVLMGDACKNKTKYLHLDKTYTVDILFGMSTDTGDVLGKLKHTFFPSEIETKQFKLALEESVKSLTGKRKQLYPAYSSRNIKKILKGETPEEKENNIEMYAIEILKINSISREALEKRITKDIHSVIGEFRQKEILKEWQDFFAKNTQKIFTTAQIKVFCSSGTYMRVLAEEIGLKLGLPALALHIKRDKVHIT